ncbi:MAG: glycosyltransferase [Bacteroidales bacterium]|nr:glycosyltransferase [Bacteroidales bacterium]
MLSIIIPVYNASAFLPRCLESIIAQSFTDWEAILINDGSTDDSEIICNEYARKDPRFHVLTKKNSGVSSSRNSGLKQIRGEWTTFVDADDFLPRDALALLLGKITEKNSDLVIAGYEVFDEHLSMNYLVSERTEAILDRDGAIALMYKPQYYRYLGYAWGKLFKSSIIRSHNLQFSPDISFNEDRLFVTSYLAYCTQVLFTTEPVYCYYEHSASAMASLKRGFNPKFLTDLDAMIRMKRIVAHCSPDNIPNATEGIASSFWRIRLMMQQFHAQKMVPGIILHCKLISSLSFKDYFRLIIRRYFLIIQQKLHRKTNHG